MLWKLLAYRHGDGCEQALAAMRSGVAGSFESGGVSGM